MKHKINSEHLFDGKPYGVFCSDGLSAIAPIVNGELNGKAIRFFPNTDFDEGDAIEGYFEMVDGVFHGVYERFDFNNRLLEEGEFKFGLLDGIITTYRYINKKKYIHMISEYENGVLSGDYKKYAPNGNIVIHTKYQDGLKNGKEQLFNIDGQLIGVSEYENGMKCGIQYEYNIDGRVTNCIRYEIINGISLGLDDYERVIFDSVPIRFGVKKWYELFFYDIVSDNEIINNIVKDKDYCLAFLMFCKKMKLNKKFK